MTYNTTSILSGVIGSTYKSRGTNYARLSQDDL